MWFLARSSWGRASPTLWGAQWHTIAMVVVAITFMTSSPLATEATPQDSPVTLSTPMLKASFVAYGDFARWLSAKETTAGAFAEHVADIDNYSVVLSEDDANYVVEFRPMPFEGQPVKGGSSRYKIGKSSFQIEEVLRFR